VLLSLKAPQKTQSTNEGKLGNNPHRKNKKQTYFKAQSIPLAKHFDFAEENKSSMTERRWTVL